MNRYLHAVAAAAILISALGSSGCATSGAGCGNGGIAGNCGRDGSCEDHYRNWWDVCWPERYNYAAREATLAPFAQQAATGHFLEQTIWNWYFEPGTDRLTQGGIEKLDAVCRATPAADPRLYIQTARDLVVTAENANNIVALRDELNARRAAAIRRYLSTEPGVAVAYEVYVHDAPVPGIYAPFAMTAFNGQRMGYKGGITLGASGGGTGGGAAGQPPAPLTTINNNQTPPGGAPNGQGTGGLAPGGPGPVGGPGSGTGAGGH